MHLECVVSLFYINYLILNYLRLIIIRPFLTSLLTAIFIILSTWLIRLIIKDFTASGYSYSR